ncbi:MAG: glycoside hydrolase family 15 protein [Chloroflexi bacterium]|nr:glycoside hydrolase family 15 protein [Chloroflexota bacterium]
MASRTDYPDISDYGIISDMHSCALVSSAGSVDWCCFPRFDSDAIFGRILDWDRGGYFKIAPRNSHAVSRRYIPGTNVLQTTFTTDNGVAQLTDFMPVHHDEDAPIEPYKVGETHQIMRIIECIEGSVALDLACHPRFEYGSIVPHTQLFRANIGFAHGGSNAISLYCSVPLRMVEGGFVSEGTLRQGQKAFAIVTYETRFSYDSHSLNSRTIEQSLAEATRYWQEWSDMCTYEGPYADHVQRSALTLKALTYAPSGGMVAAPTTSLPELIGGERNWDYRYTWIRDASFAIYGLHIIGYQNEAKAFRNWIQWATVGRARDLHIMYGLGGERRLTEVSLPELSGYRDSAPARIGNGAYDQFQLDAYGELLDSAHLYRRFIGPIDGEYWAYLLQIVEYVLENWEAPDEGVWEARSGRQHNVFSKAWCWVALDRAIKMVAALDLPGDVELWKRVRTEIREQILEQGFNEERGVFTQAYGSDLLDSANLMLPLIGFIKADDPRMLATIRATQRELTSEQGFLYRYRGFDDGLHGEEGTFNICSFWMCDNLIMLGEIDEATELFDRLLEHTNDLGLMSEEIDPHTGDMLGNFPQAFSHLSIINTAVQLQRARRRQARRAAAG